MKKHLMTILTGALFVFCSMLVFTAPASAYSIGAVNVGGVDTLLGYGEVNSGDLNELNWVNQVLAENHISTQYTMDNLVKYTNSSDGWNWTLVNGETKIYASDLQGTPEYYYIKIGNGGLGTSTNHFLYKNEADLAWAVINLGTSFGDAFTIGALSKISDSGRISHTGELSGSTPVPEPGTIMLLGIGMFALAIFGKRKMNNQ